MPRRLIIAMLIVLILGILGGTVVLIMQRLGSDEDPTATPTPGTLSPADTGSQPVVNPTADDDSDSLSNADEALWGTSTTNPDSDGDGFNDGEEVAADHNPTIAGPNDVLPANFEPGQNIQPLEEAPLQVDQFFEENLDLTGGNKNLTDEFKSQFSEDKQTQAAMAAYVQQQPIITKLPAVKDSAIQIAPDSGALATQSYLSSVSNYESLSNKEGLSYGLEQLVQGNDPSIILGLAADIRRYQDKLRAQRVPTNSLALHKLLLSYTELLAATFDQIALWPQDPVKSMVAIRQLEAIDNQYFPLLLNEFSRLGAP